MYNVSLMYKISVFILFYSTTISGLELLLVPRPYLMLIYSNYRSNGKVLAWRVLHALQIAVSMLCAVSLLFLSYTWFQLAFLLLTIVTTTSYLVRKNGRNGCDQVRMLTLVSYSFCFLLDRDMAQLISICFSGTQIIIGYATAGLAKVFAKQWRQGDILSQILNTYSYGVPKFSKFLNDNPRMHKVATYSSVAVILATPVSFFLPYHTLLLVSLALIFCFHILTAVLMGLNDFFITFPLGYTGILIMHQYIFPV